MWRRAATRLGCRGLRGSAIAPPPPPPPLVNEPIEESQLLHVAVLGMPNCGKSLLTNQLIGSPVSAVSSKVHTTRELVAGIAVHGRTQLILSDTPGLLSRHQAKRSNIKERPFMADAERSLQQAHAVIVMVSVESEFWRSHIHPRLLYLLHKYRPPLAVLVLNKVDLVRSRNVLISVARRLTGDVVGGAPVESQLRCARELAAEPYSSARRRRLGMPSAAVEPSAEMKAVVAAAVAPPPTREQLARPVDELMDGELRARFRGVHGWPHFDALFFTSALQGDGLDALRSFLLSKATAGAWKYDAATRTDRSPKDICVAAVRAKLLDLLKRHLPYRVGIEVSRWHETEHAILSIGVDVFCDSDKAATAVIGPGGAYIRQITEKVDEEMRTVLERDVYVTIAVQRRSK